MAEPLTRPLDFLRLSEAEMQQRADEFKDLLSQRRTVRDFSSEAVPSAIIEQCLLTAGSAPSGANRQPWHFAVVSAADLKKKIRKAAEAEERDFYENRAPNAWLDALAPLGTDANKPFLEEAPYLIVVFAEKYSFDAQGIKQKNYYVPESVGIACGLLITALHNAGLATLTHTPSPMKFLNTLLNRPESEKPLMIIVTGYPSIDATVPNITRKSLDEIASFFRD
mgnify:CR=1 FL=1